MRDISVMHGADFAKSLGGLSESEATARVMAECPEWTRHRVLRYFAAAGLYGYTCRASLGEISVYQNGAYVPTGAAKGVG